MMLRLAFLILVSTVVNAVEVTRIYQSRCQTTTGVLLGSDMAKLYVLSSDGELLEVEKHRVLGLARYSLKEFAIRGTASDQRLPLAYRFVTKSEFETTKVIEGWANGYSKEYVQVYGTDQQEYQIIRSSIWDIEMIEEPLFLRASPGPEASFALADPLEFQKCAPPQSDQIKPFLSYSREILLNTYFNELLEGQKQLYDDSDERDFYAVPQIYRNETRLGTWALLGSRYSEAGSRRVNFLPYVVDSTSEGPFRFQRRIHSGLAPVEWIDHSEPILSGLYELKASYIHFRFFLDPAIILLGDRYRWSFSQLDSLDDRPAPIGGGRFGIDIGHWSLFATVVQGYYGIKFKENFVTFDYSLSSFGILYQQHRFATELMLGFGTSNRDKVIDRAETKVATESDYIVARANINWAYSSDLLLRSSLIVRELSFTTDDEFIEWNFDSSTSDIAVEADWSLDHRWQVHTRLMTELSERTSSYASPSRDSPETKKSYQHYKAASGITLAF